MEASLNVKTLGQVFTPNFIVAEMLKLIKNNGSVLEPSCGDGAFSKNIPGCTAIEFDKSVCPKDAINIDFFDFDEENKFDTIIGNPPYVRFQDIQDSTKEKLDMSLFDERSNLYLFFIHKCIKHLKQHGELIFIVPRDFFKASSSIKLNNFIYNNGTITDLIELGDAKVFQDACPNCVIFRFEKGDFSRVCNICKKFKVINGQIIFTANEYSVDFRDLFYVKVGAVSGNDKIFENKRGNMEFVCSKTQKTGELRKMFYNTPAKELEQYKEVLVSRKIKKFDEKTWFMWGRDYHKSDRERIYVNQKTRNKNPFFYNECKAYDGSVLAIFPKFKCTKEMSIQVANDLNSVNWEELGFVCDGRFIFSQKSLENIILPKTFSKYMNLLEQISLL